VSEFQPYIDRANELLDAMSPMPPPPLWYLVRCIDCDMVIPFGTADDCSIWVLDHTEATGHTASVWQEARS
jgi:hypothetical protein